MSYSPLKVNRRFGETCRLHLHGQRISWARNRRESRWHCLTFNRLHGVMSQKIEPFINTAVRISINYDNFWTAWNKVRSARPAVRRHGGPLSRLVVNVKIPAPMENEFWLSDPQEVTLLTVLSRLTIIILLYLFVVLVVIWRDGIDSRYDINCRGGEASEVIWHARFPLWRRNHLTRRSRPPRI
jgi:hypothetical protein